MTTHAGLPVAGYQPQSSGKVRLVNENKELEETILRRLDLLKVTTAVDGQDVTIDGRWLAVGRTHIEEAFMAINRAIFQPGRVKLPGDGP